MHDISPSPAIAASIGTPYLGSSLKISNAEPVPTMAKTIEEASKIGDGKPIGYDVDENSLTLSSFSVEAKCNRDGVVRIGCALLLTTPI